MSDAVLKFVYDELHRQAQGYLSRERAGHTLQTTALVHEVYLKLVKQDNIVWESRSHFFGIAGKLMRQILIDYARTKYRAKRGGGKDKVPLENALTVGIGDANFDFTGTGRSLDASRGQRRAPCQHCRTQIFQRFECGRYLRGLRHLGFNHQTGLADGKGLAPPRII